MTSPILLGPFELIRPLRAGRHAEVWRAAHQHQGLPVAVRLVTGQAASDRDYRSAFRNEVRSAAALQHPSILTVLDYGLTEAEIRRSTGEVVPAGAPWMAMELASAGTLRAAVDEALPWADLRGVLLAVLDALAHAHARGVVHRDLRPGVVRICGQADPRPGLKLSDFGLAHAARWQQPAEAIRAEVRPHWAPEQVEGRWRDQGPWTDLWALGCLTWKLCTGLDVWGELEGESLAQAIVEAQPPGFRARRGVPPGLEDWLRRLLSRQPKTRYRWAADAAWALRKLGHARGGLREQAGRTLSELDGDDLGVELHTIHTDLTHTRGSVRTSGDAPPMPETWRHAHPDLPPLQLVGAGLSLYWLRTPTMVGRQAERDAIWETLGQVASRRRARMVLLRGPAGTGRSRIVEWMCERAQELGAATVLRMSHGPRSDPRDALGRMIGQFLRCGRLSRAEVSERVATWLLDQGEDDPYEADALTEVLAPATQRQRVEGGRQVSFSTTDEPFAVVRRFLEHLSRERPVIVWMDDVQWGAHALEFAAQMLRAQAMSPSAVLFLATAREDALAERPEESARIEALSESRAVRTVEVQPLPRPEHERLVRNLLRLEGELAQQVVERTDGNPLFAVQLVGDWVLRGVLEVGATGFKAKEGASLDLPDDLYEVWSGRVERLLAELPAEAASHLELAAALGLEVDDDEWQEATDDPTGFLRRDLTGGRFGFNPANMRIRADLVEDLLEARLVIETDTGWAFVHPMLRESLERRAREGGHLADHHRAAAMMLQRRQEDGQPWLSERIARHLAAAGLLDQAIGQLITAASERMQTTGAQEADALLGDARQALRILRVPESDPRWTRLALVYSEVEAFRGHVEGAVEWGQLAVSRARQARHEALLPLALEALGEATLSQGRADQARSLLEQARAGFDAVADPLGVARSLMALARTTPALDQRQQLLEQALALFEQAGRGDSASYAQQALAQVAIQRQDYARAIALLDGAEALALAHGSRLPLAEVANGRGEVARRTGDIEAATAGYQRALELFEASGSVLAILPRLNLALVSLQRGRGRVARQVIAPVLGHLERHPQRPFLEFATVVMLAASAGTEDWSEWDRCMSSLDRLLADTVHVDRDLAETAEMAAQLAWRAGQGERARVAFDLAARQWESVGDLERAARMRGASV